MMHFTIIQHHTAIQHNTNKAITTTTIINSSGVFCRSLLLPITCDSVVASSIGFNGDMVGDEDVCFLDTVVASNNVNVGWLLGDTVKGWDVGKFVGGKVGFFVGCFEGWLLVIGLMLYCTQSHCLI